MNPTKEWPVRVHKTEALRLVKNWKFDREMISSRNARQALGEAKRFLMLSKFLAVAYSCNGGEKEVDYSFLRLNWNGHMRQGFVLLEYAQSTLPLRWNQLSYRPNKVILLLVSYPGILNIQLNFTSTAEFVKTQINCEL